MCPRLGSRKASAASNPYCFGRSGGLTGSGRPWTGAARGGATRWLPLGTAGAGRGRAIGAAPPP